MLLNTKNAIEVIQHLKTLKGTNEKIAYLTDNQDDPLRLIFAMAYDKVNYTWGCTLKQVMRAEGAKVETDLGSALMWLLNSACNTKGRAVCNALKSFIVSLPDMEADILKDVIDRNLHIGLNIKSINKALGGIIPVVEYMRCDIFSDNHKIAFPALLQIKMDGTWREVQVSEGKVQIFTRQGHRYSNPVLEKNFTNVPHGRYIGELTIPNLSRVQSNGNINSSNPDFDNIHFTVWDYVTDPNIPYSERFEALKAALPRSNLVHMVETIEVASNDEALAIVSEWIKRGEEGGVLKSKSGKFKNGTSKDQLKIKRVLEIDVRVTGFTAGTERTARDGKIGAIVFATDDGKIAGQTSGFDQALLDEISKQPDVYLGKVMTVQCNDLQLAEGSEIHHLMHPRFVEFREKAETDTLERVLKMLKSATLI